MKNIAVIMGGKSTEHSVSIESGVSVICNLDPKKYKVFPVLIEKTGEWTIFPEYNQSIPRNVYRKLIETNHLEKQTSTLPKALDNLLDLKVEFFFLALHGQYGEDGTIQGLCEQLGLPYNGSKVLASALGMDKLRSSREFERIGLLTPRQMELPNLFIANNSNNLKDIVDRIERWFGFPCLVKPRYGGSSLGMGLANNKKDLKKAITEAQKVTDDILIQELIRGREFTVGILDTKKQPIALPPTEIVSQYDFFDYHSKYHEGAVEITPAKIPPTQAKKLQDIALKAHQSLGCSGYSRTDIIIKDSDTEDSYYVLETNTLPGLTTKSVFPQQASAQGIEFENLLDQLIEHGSKVAK